jgi:hypothetical protein
MHNPALDVTGMLGDPDRWHYRLFTEHTFDALVHAQREFDCVVLGCNVIYRNKGLAEVINARQLQIGVVLLHQLEIPGSSTLRITEDLAVSSIRLSTPRTDADVADRRDPWLEILLNWPEPVNVKALRATAFCELQPEHDSPWRSVLKVDGSSLVLIRSSLPRSPPVVCCSLLLEPGRPEHYKLLRNLIVFASAGPPKTVVLPGQDTPWRTTLVQKLRARRVNALELTTTSGLDFERWPLRAAWDVVSFGTHGPIANEDRWLARGGRLGVVDPSTGELSVRYRASDLQWVARRWSSWLQGEADEHWRHSVLAARAYLRTLSALETTLGEAELRRVGLRPCSEHDDPIRTLIDKRLGKEDNLEGTIGATAAVLEIDSLVGGVLPDEHRRRVRKWLSDGAGDADAEDALAISRALEDGENLDHARGKVRRPLSTSTVTRLRLAGVACKQPLEAMRPDEKDRQRILAEVSSSLLGAAEYLSSAAIYRDFARANHWPTEELIADGDALVDTAIATLTKQGTLASSVVGGEATTEEVCAEALALATYFNLDKVPSDAFVREETVPPQLIDTLLAESQQLRERYRNVREVAARTGRSLGIAQNMLGGLVSLLAGAAAFGAEMAVEGVVANILAPLAALALVMVALGWGLAALGLCPPWLVTAAEVVNGGAQGLFTWTSSQLKRAAAMGAAPQAAADSHHPHDDDVPPEGDGGGSEKRDPPTRDAENGELP